MGTLAEKRTWFGNNPHNLSSTDITSITVFASYSTALDSYTYNWDASAEGDGSVMCYCDGANLAIVDAKNEGIYLNANSGEVFWFDNVTSLDNLNYLNASRATDFYAAFRYCNATTIDVSSWDTSNVTNMSYAFQRCTSLSSLDLSNWDVSKVTSISTLFEECTSLSSLDLSGWDVSNVTTMSYVFNKCESLVSLDISGWNPSSATTMNYLFNKCTSLVSLDLSNWNVSKVKNMAGMFQQSTYGTTTAMTTLNLSGWNVSNVTDMGFMFYGLSKVKNLDVSGWNVEKCTRFDHMFAHCRSLVVDTSKWKTKSATNMYAMFHSTANTVHDCSNFDTSNVTVFGQMFEGCSNLTKVIGLEKFDTSNCIEFSEMFQHCSSLISLDLSSFDTTKAYYGTTVSGNGGVSQCMQNMFNGCTKLQEIKLGENFSFNGDGTSDTSWYTTLPTPSSDYIPRADGKWYSFDGNTYTPSEVPNRTAGHYAATKGILYKDGIIFDYDSIANIADAIREAGNIEGKMTITDMPVKISDAINNGAAELDDLIQGNTKNFYNDRITKIADYQFYCYGGNGGTILSSVNCPNVTSVGYMGFQANYMLTSIQLPRLQSASAYAFGSASYLREVNFPELTSLGHHAFSSCGYLETVIIGTTNCVLNNADAFTGTKIASGTGYIYVPDEAVDAYKVATNWVTYANQIKGISELEG